MTELPTYVLDREFNAPLALVWKAWSDPELLARWYGPGVETVIHAFDLRPGGAWLNEMKWGDKSDRSRMDFQEVVEGEKIAWMHASTDADWNIAPSQMMPDWPTKFLTTITFKAEGDVTKVRLTQTPVDASEAEIACFANMMGGMDKGWGSGFDIIAEILAEMQA